jgi:hypothetical protein
MNKGTGMRILNGQGQALPLRDIFSELLYAI